MSISITFSHDDPISGRWFGVEGGRPMTAYECDLDLYNIKVAVETLQANYTATISIATITQPSPSTMRVTKTDATFYDLDLPSATFVDRGEWAADTTYFVNDTLTANGTLYLVPFEHTSADTFDPGANDGMGHDYYSAMLSLPGNALPAGGAVRMSLKKSSGTDYAVTWGFDIASDVVFTPSTGSTLSSDNVADALEELAVQITEVVVDASDVTFAPPTGSELVSTNVAAALVELETLIDGVTVDAVDVTFTPPTGSALVSTNVADALVELEGMTGGGGSGDMLAANNLSDLANASTMRTTLGLAIGTDVQAYDAQLSSLVRQNSQSTAYTTVLTDGGKHLLHPSADTTARTFTIDSNANVAYPIGTAITFINQNAGGVITIAITSDTMRLAGAGTTGSRALAANGIATAIKITSTEWIISGTGLT